MLSGIVGWRTVYVTLEFFKLTDQISRMSEYLAAQEDEDRSKVDYALEIMEAYADPAFIDDINDKVQLAVDRDAGYRGARLIDEPLMNAYPLPDTPQSATLIATDGSQILPNTHGSALYYVLNTGSFILHLGSGEAPTIHSQPYLFYEKGYLLNEDRGIITPTIVSARRNVAEMQALAEHGWHQRDMARPIIALLDGPLLFVMGSDVPDRTQLRAIYFGAMERLREVHAGLCGYTDRPRSRFMVALLHLLLLEEKDITRKKLSNDGPLEGLQDAAVYTHLLEPGARSALFIQMSPANKEFRQAGGDTHEICFFYMNSADAGERPKIARVEVPVWVADDKQLVDEVHALIYQQCQQVATRYPYALTRADELAIVKREEALQFDTMVKVSLTRQGMIAEDSNKQRSKDASRGKRTQFKVEDNNT